VYMCVCIYVHYAHTRTSEDASMASSADLRLTAYCNSIRTWTVGVTATPHTTARFREVVHLSLPVDLPMMIHAACSVQLAT